MISIPELHRNRVHRHIDAYYPAFLDVLCVGVADTRYILLHKGRMEMPGKCSEMAGS
jgi:hypothetical protein